MLDSHSIRMLYDNVLVTDIQEFNIPTEAVMRGIESMAEVYKPGTTDLTWDRPVIADFNDVAHRCAYLHKYASLHTAMVKDLLSEAVASNYNFFKDWVFSQHNFKICCLGGGPGSDAIGSLAALQGAFSYFRASVDIIDFFVNWKFSFYSILRELGSGWYGSFGSNTSRYLDYHYVEANLLKPLSQEVLDSLSQASLVTMIKFASAAACQDTDSMMRKIFACMKPGAMVLFIDNDGGGFHQIFVDAATRHNFTSVFGPFRHRNYVNEITKVKKFGYMSCFRSTVTVHMIRKPEMPFHSASPYMGNRSRRVQLDSPSFFVSPPTPLLFRPGSNFRRDENKDFRSPIPSISTPGTSGIKCNRQRKKHTSKGCFPFTGIRHRLGKKVNKFKSRARAVFKKKITHPIFEI